ncbi:hypothetical protein IM697_18550 [Streptomyces ferrugineus]|uniref:Uncharacterized protein n=1 Tax=Streptomyces ferrugineus TaxID=1413221 RepID=A0A7M2SXI1_9ACTN|nr:hypothetical protein [Streptomyces ferrugineus]QOV40223.1 hypothetical protein IM697_18550 [Streptomyces ferrugineus]
MRTNLLARHIHAVTGGQPQGCTCPRAACGGAEQGPGVPFAGCQAHGAITRLSHRAFDCPALPADADVSRLYILVTKWTDDGPALLRAYSFDRVLLADLRGGSTLWDVSEGDSAEDAARAWQARVDEMRAEAVRRQAAQVAEAQERARTRRMAEAALRSSAGRSARRILANPGDL